MSKGKITNVSKRHEFMLVAASRVRFYTPRERKEGRKERQKKRGKKEKNRSQMK